MEQWNVIFPLQRNSVKISFSIHKIFDLILWISLLNCFFLVALLNKNYIDWSVLFSFFVHLIIPPTAISMYTNFNLFFRALNFINDSSATIWCFRHKIYYSKSFLLSHSYVLTLRVLVNIMRNIFTLHFFNLFTSFC